MTVLPSVISEKGHRKIVPDLPGVFAASSMAERRPAKVLTQSLKHEGSTTRPGTKSGTLLVRLVVVDESKRLDRVDLVVVVVVDLTLLDVNPLVFAAADARDTATPASTAVTYIIITITNTAFMTVVVVIDILPSPFPVLPNGFCTRK